jgi:hypothetical protein
MFNDDNELIENNKQKLLSMTSRYTNLILQIGRLQLKSSSLISENAFILGWMVESIIRLFRFIELTPEQITKAEIFCDRLEEDYLKDHGDKS